MLKQFIRQGSIILFLMGISNILPAQTTANKDRELNLRTNSHIMKFEVVDHLTGNIELPFSSTMGDSDTLLISLYYPNHHSFKIYSEIDTIAFNLPLDHAVIISVFKDNEKPIVLNIQNGFSLENISFDEYTKNNDFSIIYENDVQNSYLKELRSKYPIDSIISSENTDLGKVRKIASWVHQLWEHDGINEPEKKDALYILDEVKKGKRFRCVEYGIVTTACLNSLGIKARTVALKTKDVETRLLGAGHVILEVFLNDLNKWIMVDPQWDIIPHIKGHPLNAIEFQAAITNRENIDIWSSEQNQEHYLPWIYPYLYYFSISFDNRENVSQENRYIYQEKTDLMLVPKGAKNPTVFQQKYPMTYFSYTNSLKDFYGKP